MLRRGDPNARSSENLPIVHRQEAKPRPLRGLLKLLEGQIPTNSDTAATGSQLNFGGSSNGEALVSVYRYHGTTLRESQKELQKKKRSTTATSANHNNINTHSDVIGNDGQPLLIPISKHSVAFESVVKRHKFVAFFVVQGFWNVTGNPCYSAHTLTLRRILATDYHDVLSTFVLDLGDDNDTAAMSIADEETGGLLGTNDHPSQQQHHSFCNGTGFCHFPTTVSTRSTTLALLQISKLPAVVVLDAHSGRIVAQDAILAMERNDSHTVINRWQSKQSGLSMMQQLGAVATCDCSHGPCCSASGGGCCVVQ